MTKKYLQAVLAIEFFQDPNNQPNTVLQQSEVVQFNQQMTKELLTIIPKLDDSSYAVIGCLYQSNEILQPGFPIHGQLRQYLNASLKAENNKRNQLIIGANDTQLPQGFNAPSENLQSPMLYLPFIIVTDNEQTQNFFEQDLMHKGMGSVELLKLAQLSFTAKIRHLNFMTILDLSAMMHNHLQAAGFEPLWHLLEQALFNSDPETKVKTDQGNEFYLSKRIVFTPFFSQHYWTKVLGRNEEDYFPWLYIQRQYQSALFEHGMDVRVFLPESWPIDDKHICFASLDQLKIESGYFQEVHSPINKNSSIDVKKINHPDLGLIYFKVEDEFDGVEYYYPVSSEGISNIQHKLKIPSQT